MKTPASLLALAAWPIGFLLLAAPPTFAQDTLRLPELRADALRNDPRIGQFALYEQMHELRLRDVDAARLPQLSVGAEATYQSAVPGIPINVPGVTVPEAPKDRYGATLNVEQMILDGGTVAGRRTVEQAQLMVSKAEVEAALYSLRTEVDESFFTAFLLQERLAELETHREDLEANLVMLRARVRSGAALAGDTAVLAAELLGLAESRDEIAARRRAALAVLEELSGREITERDAMVLPDFSDQVDRARAMLVSSPVDEGIPDPLRTHPAYAVYAAQHGRVAAETELIESRNDPQLSAFVQVGYGRPGLKQFTDDFDLYWISGIRLRWAPWDWGTAERAREQARVREMILETEEEAFTDRLRRGVQDEIITIDRLRAALETDREIIALREIVERQARTQLESRAIPASAYVDVRTDLREARIALGAHRVELARAQVQFLTVLGLDFYLDPSRRY